MKEERKRSLFSRGCYEVGDRVSGDLLANGWLLKKCWFSGFVESRIVPQRHRRVNLIETHAGPFMWHLFPLLENNEVNFHLLLTHSQQGDNTDFFKVSEKSVSTFSLQARYVKGIRGIKTVPLSSSSHPVAWCHLPTGCPKQNPDGKCESNGIISGFPGPCFRYLFSRLFYHFIRPEMKLWNVIWKTETAERKRARKRSIKTEPSNIVELKTGFYRGKRFYLCMEKAESTYSSQRQAQNLCRSPSLTCHCTYHRHFYCM